MGRTVNPWVSPCQLPSSFFRAKDFCVRYLSLKIGVLHKACCVPTQYTQLCVVTLVQWLLLCIPLNLFSFCTYFASPPRLRMDTGFADVAAALLSLCLLSCSTAKSPLTDEKCLVFLPLSFFFEINLHVWFMFLQKIFEGCYWFTNVLVICIFVNHAFLSTMVYFRRTCHPTSNPKIDR